MKIPLARLLMLKPRSKSFDGNVDGRGTSHTRSDRRLAQQFGVLVFDEHAAGQGQLVRPQLREWLDVDARRLDSSRQIPHHLANVVDDRVAESEGHGSNLSLVVSVGGKTDFVNLRVGPAQCDDAFEGNVDRAFLVESELLETARVRGKSRGYAQTFGRAVLAKRPGVWTYGCASGSGCDVGPIDPALHILRVEQQGGAHELVVLDEMRKVRALVVAVVHDRNDAHHRGEQKKVNGEPKKVNHQRK